MRVSALVAFIFGGLLFCGPTQSQDAFIAAANRDEDNRVSIARHLSPVLLKAATGAVIYYRGDCSTSDALSLPVIDFQTPANNATALQAIEEIFQKHPNTRVTLDSNGVIRIELNKVQKRILSAKIAFASFDESEQYTPQAALDGLFGDNDYLRMAEKRLRVHQPIIVTSIGLNGPQTWEQPHLPPSLKNMSVGQILDLIAKSWRGVAFYGVSCDDPNEYFIEFKEVTDDERDWPRN